MRQACILGCLAAVAGAGGISEQIPLAPDAAFGGGHDPPISTSLFAELEELSRLVDITYCVGIAGSGIQEPFDCPSRCSDFKDIELVTAWNTGPLLSDSCGYIAVSHAAPSRRVIVAFRGTYSIANTVADLSSVPQEYIPYPGGDDGSTLECENCTVHTGFYSSWLNTRNTILPDIEKSLEKYSDAKLVMVGHSLGGAVAALGGLDLLTRGYDPTVTTFGEPRIGNQALADYVDKQFGLRNSSRPNKPHGDCELKFRRVTHLHDPVPLLPPREISYVPHGGEIFISKAELPPSVADIRLCHGATDPACISGPQGRAPGWWKTIKNLFELWQLFFAHRDYFWRLGMCLPLSKW